MAGIANVDQLNPRVSNGPVSKTGRLDGVATAAGFTGEVLSANAAAVTVSTSSGTNITSLALAAGRWLIWAVYNHSGSSSNDAVIVALNTTSGLTTGTLGKDRLFMGMNNTSHDGAVSFAPLVANLSSSTTYYLNAQTGSNNDTGAGNGYIVAQRID